MDYNLNDGDGWIDFAEGASWTDGFVIADISFADALDNQADVDLRIRTDSWASIAGFLDIDNVQVNAVPEPSDMAVLLGLAGLGLALLRRRRLED